MEDGAAEVEAVGEVLGVFDVVGLAGWGSGGCGCAVVRAVCRAIGRTIDGVREYGCRRGEVDVLQRVSRVALRRRGFEGAAVVRVRGRVGVKAYRVDRRVAG